MQELKHSQIISLLSLGADVSIDSTISTADKLPVKSNTYKLPVTWATNSDKVTIGEGYNDVKAILNSTFSLSDKACKLSDYSGYSDASSQYEIKTLNITKKR